MVVMGAVEATGFLDLTCAILEPLSTRILGDFGADAITAEPRDRPLEGAGALARSASGVGGLSTRAIYKTERPSPHPRIIPLDSLRADRRL